MRKSNTWSEERLIKAFSDGGALREEATDYLMNDFIHYVPSVAKKTGIKKDVALDAFTDAILDMIDQVSNGIFKGQSKLSSYFYKIFYYKCIDLSRKNTTKLVDYRNEVPDISDARPTASSHLETKEEVAQLHQHLKQLGEPCQQILMDWGYWGYNMDEIAKRAGLQGSVQAKDKKYRCLQRLRKLMGFHPSKKGIIK